jgi:hypothetical protein
LILCGCTSKQTAKNNIYANIPITEIQINPVPHPLNVDGFYPYVIWVNGERVRMKPGDIQQLAIALDLPLYPPTTPEMHAGSGWLRPLDLTKK